MDIVHCNNNSTYDIYFQIFFINLFYHLLISLLINITCNANTDFKFEFKIMQNCSCPHQLFFAFKGDMNFSSSFYKITNHMVMQSSFKIDVKRNDKI